MPNLLPWRENMRRKVKQRLMFGLLFVLMVSIAVLIAWSVILSRAINSESLKLEKIKSKQVRSGCQISEREQVNQIKNMHTTRLRVLNFMHILLASVPNSVQLTEFRLQKKCFTIVGLMHNANDSVSLLQSLSLSSGLENRGFKQWTTSSGKRFFQIVFYVT